MSKLIPNPFASVCNLCVKCKNDKCRENSICNKCLQFKEAE